MRAARGRTLGDSSLIGRRVATLEQVTCASPAYLRQYGEPQSLDDLARHRAVNYLSKTSGRHYPFEFLVDGELKEVQLEGRVAVFGAELYVASAIAGIGLVQVPRYRVASQIAEGLLRVLLPECPPPPMPVSVLYPHNRHMSPRVRVFVDWLSERFAEAQRLPAAQS